MMELGPEGQVGFSRKRNKELGDGHRRTREGQGERNERIHR